MKKSFEENERNKSFLSFSVADSRSICAVKGSTTGRRFSGGSEGLSERKKESKKERARKPERSERSHAEAVRVEARPLQRD